MKRARDGEITSLPILQQPLQEQTRGRAAPDFAPSTTLFLVLRLPSGVSPSIAPSYQTKLGPSHDTCGYCGEEFPNLPQPHWVHRLEHLTIAHKFGECNMAKKKFYRVDHFRQ